VVAKVKVGGNPCGVARLAGAVWVSDADRGLLFRVDPSTGTATQMARLDAKPCAITTAYGSLWVVTQSGRLDRVSPQGKIIARIPVGDTSYQAVATPHTIWVSNRNGGSLTEVDPATNRVRSTLPLPGVSPGGMTYAGGMLWVGDDTSGSNHFLRLNLHTRHTTKVAAGQRPAYLTNAAGAVWVSDVEDGTVRRIDTTTLKTTATVQAGASPVNLDARHDGSEVWVPDDTGGHVVRIEAHTARALETIDAPGAGPAIVDASTGDVWVSMFAVGEVWRIHPGP
jgi:YVTN family beta-propeller protein